MINTNTSIASMLSGLYSTNGSQQTQLESQIASGKRVVNPSDDFGAYVKSSALNADISANQVANQDLQNAAGMVSYATQVGNDIAADFTQLQNLATTYGATTDATQQGALATQYNALITQIGNTISDAMYNGTAVYNKTTLETASSNSGGGTIAVAATAVGSTAAINNITTATATDIQNEINNCQTYVADMGSYANEINTAISLNNTAVSSDQATISALTDDNQAEDMTNLTSLQVQQEAIVSMMSQANSSQAAIAKLFA
jgi:flagellin